MDNRILNEKLHGEKIVNQAADIWNWNSPAGKKRLQRRAGFFLETIQPDNIVLELGCGIGLFTQELTRSHAQRIIAIDISPDLLQIAQKSNLSKVVEFRIENAYQMSFKSETFDVVLGSSVLHHLEIDQALMEIYRVLKPGGRIIFTEPNYLNPQIFLERKVPYLKKKLMISPDETAFVRWSLLKKMQRAGFSNIRLTPFDFLHPNIPIIFIAPMEKMMYILEHTPLIREIAGSILIKAEKSPRPQ